MFSTHERRAVTEFSSRPHHMPTPVGNAPLQVGSDACKPTVRLTATFAKLLFAAAENSKRATATSTRPSIMAEHHRCALAVEDWRRGRADEDYLRHSTDLLMSRIKGAV